MARLIIHNEKGPCEVNVGDESKWICMCGLSKNKPLCDGSHKATQDESENALYKYEDDVRTEVKS